MKKKKVVLIISILAAILILAGLTYAYYTSGIVGSESTSTITLSSGYMEIVVDGGEQIITEGIYPNSAEPFATKTIKLTGKNTTVKNMIYVLKLVVDTNTFSTGAIKYTLEGTNTSENGELIPNTTLTDVNNTIYLGTGYYTKGSNLKHEYTLKIYFPETGKDQSIDMEKTFQAHIEAVSEEEPAPEGWFTAPSTTLLGAIRDDNVVTAPLTLPGKRTNLFTLDKASEASFAIDSTYKDYYYTYGTDIEETSIGYFTLKDVHTCKFSDVTCQDALVDKYIVGTAYNTASNSTDTIKTTTGISDIIKVTNVAYTETDKSYIYYKRAYSLTINEAEMSSAPDDYGISYYFRGNMENNYVIFADKCWKIVRVDGNGNVKLFYWGNNVSGKCTNNSNAMVIENNTESNTSAFNNKKFDGTNPAEDYLKRTDVYSSNRPAGVGFMYGDVMGTTYASVHANTNDSDILNKLKTFYDDNIINNSKEGNLENYLADVIWCGDKSIVSNSAGTGVEFGTETRFGAYKRLINDKNPSLVCPTISKSGNIGNLSRYTAADTENGNGMLKGTNGVGTTLYKIGLITADEVAFAGGAYGTANGGYYLYSKSNYWTMSPFIFNASGHLSGVWYVEPTGSLSNSYVTGGFGVRPAVSLKSTATIEQGGDGTVNNPYVVNGLLAS